MTELVATYIARPDGGQDLAAVLAACADIMKPDRIKQLAADEAADVFFRTDDHLGTVRARLLTIASQHRTDVVVQPVAGRRKKLLLADMDSTMIGQECIDELADFAGVKRGVATITERAMHGEIEFEEALRERAALLAGLDAAVITRVIAERITVSPGARDLVWTMRASGATTILVSGGFTVFAEPVGEMIGFDEVRANTLLVADGRVTGEVAEPILGRTTKLATLEDAIIRRKLSAGQTMAVGDGANDVAVIRRAGLGVAYRAKPEVKAAADARIEYANLAALLYAQGYRKSDFVR